MATRKIIERGDETLGKVCHPVTKFDEHLAELLDDLQETLALAHGYGLAAPQVGILRRVVVVLDDQDQMIELVNPLIIHQEGEQEGWEGCLSVPGMYGRVTRPNFVTVRAQDRKGNFFEVSGEELVARCFCHELEHLDGRLFVEHTDRLYSVEELDAMEEEGEKS